MRKNCCIVFEFLWLYNFMKYFQIFFISKNNLLKLYAKLSWGPLISFHQSAFLLQLRLMERKLNVLGFKYDYFIHDFYLIAFQDLCLFLVCLFVLFFRLLVSNCFFSLFITAYLFVLLIEINKMDLNSEWCRIHSRFKF